MADIRVERTSGGRTWLWVLLALILIILVALMLERAGYINLPVNVSVGAVDAVPAGLTVVTGVPVEEG